MTCLFGVPVLFWWCHNFFSGRPYQCTAKTGSAPRFYASQPSGQPMAAAQPHAMCCRNCRIIHVRDMKHHLAPEALYGVVIPWLLNGQSQTSGCCFFFCFCFVLFCFFRKYLMARVDRQTSLSTHWETGWFYSLKWRMARTEISSGQIIQIYDLTWHSFLILWMGCITM